MSSHIQSADVDRVPRQRGEESRQLIKNELRRRVAAGLRPPTLDELHAATGLAKTTVHHHLTWMEEHRVIRIEAARREIILLEDKPDVDGEVQP